MIIFNSALCYTHLSRLNYGASDAKRRHKHDGNEVVVIALRGPHTQSEQLEYVERVDDFQKQQLQQALHLDWDVVEAIYNSSTTDKVAT
jgi:1-aminocyclopropane-1-carboxylate deaminase/D-cysteine desulfhydrase-like pyridoxal-dependent ACC family enzyme